MYVKVIAMLAGMLYHFSQTLLAGPGGLPGLLPWSFIPG